MKEPGRSVHMLDVRMRWVIGAMIFAFHLLEWKFVKKLEKAEKSTGFGDAMSNGSHDNPPYVNFEVRERREYTLKRQDMCCY